MTNEAQTNCIKRMIYNVSTGNRAEADKELKNLLSSKVNAIYDREYANISKSLDRNK